MDHPRRLHRLPVLILLAAGLGAGVACSGSGPGSPNGVASIKTPADKGNGSDRAAKKDTSKANAEDAGLAFARCMREHGVDMPDPDASGGGGMVTFGGTSASGTKIDVDMQKFQDADKACRDLLGDAGPQKMSPKQQQEAQDQALGFSRCMREHGVNMPDPTFGGQGQVTMRIDGASGIDPSDPKFEAAQQACGSAFGPAGAKAGAGLSVNGGKADAKSGGPGGAVFSVGGAPVASSGGAK
jgi:hypothetical protein